MKNDNFINFIYIKFSTQQFIGRIYESEQKNNFPYRVLRLNSLNFNEGSYKNSPGVNGVNQDTDPFGNS